MGGTRDGSVIVSKEVPLDLFLQIIFKSVVFFLSAVCSISSEQVQDHAFSSRRCNFTTYSFISTKVLWSNMRI